MTQVQNLDANDLIAEEIALYLASQAGPRTVREIARHLFRNRGPQMENKVRSILDRDNHLLHYQFIKESYRNGGRVCFSVCGDIPEPPPPEGPQPMAVGFEKRLI